MKKKVISACIGVAMSMILVSGVTTSTKVAAFEQKVSISAEQNSEENELNAKSPLFTTKYVVNVKKATMRSGPGTSYSSMGTLYKNDVVWVRSISNGWAKFKWNRKWAYISTNCIKKTTHNKHNESSRKENEIKEKKLL